MPYIRTLAIASAMTVAAALPARAQLVAFGSAEAGGQGQGLLLLGASVSRGAPGWSPVGQVVGYRFSFDAGDDDVSSFVLAPSAGLKYQTATGMIQGLAGYSIVDDEDDFVGGIAPAESREGFFTTAHLEHWGAGDRMGQLIASYNWGSEYLWSRARGAVRLGPTSPLMAGGELVFQTGEGDSRVTSIGPLLQARLSEAFRLTGVVGYRMPQGGDGTGYARLDFTWIPGAGR
jgi:hypothetical protein